MEEEKIAAAQKGVFQLSILRRVALFIAMTSSFALAFSIAEWGKEPSYRPLVNSHTIKESAKAIDVLEIHNIEYDFDIQSKTIYVIRSQAANARIRLAQAGFDMELPEVGSSDSGIEKADGKEDRKQDWWKEDWAIDYIRMCLAFVLVLALVFGVLRPLIIQLAKNVEE